MPTIDWSGTTQTQVNTPAPNAQTGRIDWSGTSSAPIQSPPIPVNNQVTPQQTVQPASSNNGNIMDAVSAFSHHVMNPVYGGFQLWDNLLSSAANKYLPNTAVSRYMNNQASHFNEVVSNRESQYQKNTPTNAYSVTGATAGEIAPFLIPFVGEGMKAAGSVPAVMTSKLLPEGSKFIPNLVGGSSQGATVAAVQPSTGQDYWSNKQNQELTGAVGGAAAPTILNAAANAISPKLSSAYQAVRDAGVNTTIGQRLGGVFNSIEEKAQSLPVVGEFISKGRNTALQSWNKATINQALAPIGQSVDSVGHEGVAQAGDKLSQAYQDTLNKIGGVQFDPQFQADYAQLKNLAGGLTPNMSNRFNSILNQNFESRVSPNGSMLADTLKNSTSDLGALARKYSGSSQASEQELGDALTQANSLISQQVARQYPELAPQLNAIDTGWAKLVRIEGAAKAAASNKVNTGIFTPGQLMSAVRGADQSVRDRATARGQALMQDWAQNGLDVLGDRVPNSGTFDRGVNGAAILGLAANPQYIPPAALATALSAGLYSAPGQKMAVDALTNRPQYAQTIADALRKFVPLSTQ